MSHESVAMGVVEMQGVMVRNYLVVCSVALGLCACATDDLPLLENAGRMPTSAPAPVAMMDATAPASLVAIPQPDEMAAMDADPLPPLEEAPQMAEPAALDLPPLAVAQSRPVIAVEPSPVPIARATPLSDPRIMAARRAGDLVNAYRMEQGLPPLALNPDLVMAASAHVATLAERNQVTARDARGKPVGERIGRFGYTPSMAASLVSGGYPTFAEALEAWKANATDNSRLLLPHAKDFGMAIHRDATSEYGIFIEAIVAAQ